MAERPQNGVIHIRFDGVSRDIPLAHLDLSDLSGDAEIKRSIAAYLEVPEAKFRDYVLDRHATGNLTIRPAAVFG